MNERGKIISLLLSIAVLLAFPLQAFCEDIQNLTYDTIEKTVLGKNPDVLQNYRDYANLDDEKTSTAVIATKGINIIKANYQIVFNVQKEFISYNNLKRKLALSQLKETQLDLQLKLITTKKKLGKATTYEVLSAQNQLDQQKKTSKDLQKQMTNIIENLNIEMGQNSDIALSIESVPMVSLDSVKAINVDEDYQKAVLQSYDIRLTEISGNSYTEPQKAEIRDEYKTFFYNIYSDLQTALEEYEYTVKQAEKALIDYNTTQKKLKYGFTSQQSYLTASYTWESTQSDLAGLKDSLYQAYQKYEYAKKGLILN